MQIGFSTVRFNQTFGKVPTDLYPVMADLDLNEYKGNKVKLLKDAIEEQNKQGTMKGRKKELQELIDKLTEMGVKLPEGN